MDPNVLVALLSLGASLLSGASAQKAQPKFHEVPTLSEGQQALYGGLEGMVSDTLRDHTKRSEDFYQTNVHRPVMQSFQEEIMPGINKSFVGPGTFWGSERLSAANKAGSDVAASLAGQRSQIFRQGEQDAFAQAMQMLQVPQKAIFPQPAQATTGQYVGESLQQLLAALLQGGYFERKPVVG